MIFTLLFRPLPGEVTNIFGLVAGFENLLMLLLFLYVVKKIRWKDTSNPIIQWMILLIIIWSIFYAFGASYNLGTIVRYRLQILPFLVCTLLYFARPREAKKSLAGKVTVND
jgi:hypothetical protein